MKAQKEDRLVKVYKLLLDQASRHEILEYCSKNWGLQRASADNLIQEASRMLSEDVNKSRDATLATFVKALVNIYKEALAQGNLQVARQTIMDQAKLLGLDQTTVNHIVDDKRELANLSDDELDKILNDERPSH